MDTTTTNFTTKSSSFSSSSMPPHLPSKSISTVLFTLLILTTTCSAFVPRNGLGHLKMCPPGGEAFATAWQLTCGMRKKRSVDNFYENSATMKLESNSPTTSPINDLIAEDVTEMDPTIRSRRSSSSSQDLSKQFRPLRLTEMMHFCCRYGCSFRDLLPYCDPFGQWDS